MIVGVVRIELHIPQARSLKDKRQVIKSLAQRISHRFNVSVSEINNHELWQRGDIAVAHVANRQRDAEKLLKTVAEFAEDVSGGEIIRTSWGFYNPEKD